MKISNLQDKGLLKFHQRLLKATFNLNKNRRETLIRSSKVSNQVPPKE